MEEIVESPHSIKHETVKRPMNAFLIFCKRHRGLVHQKNPSLDNRSVTRILGDLWANLGPDEKYAYTDLAKQYKEAFLKANPDYKWYNPEKHSVQLLAASNKSGKPSVSLSSTHSMSQALDGISPGKLADPSNMGGLSMLLMAGQQTFDGSGQTSTFDAGSISLSQAVTRNVGLTPICSATVNFDKLDSAEDLLSIWKHRVALPVDFSHSTDNVMLNWSRESVVMDAIKEEIQEEAQRLVQSDFNSSQTISRFTHGKLLGDVTGKALQFSLVSSDSCAGDNTPGQVCSSALTLEFNGSLPSVNHSGSGLADSSSSVAGSDQKTAKFIGNPLTYLFSQPAHQMAGWPSKTAVAAAASMQVDLPSLGRNKPTESSELLPASATLISQVPTSLSGVSDGLVTDVSKTVCENLNRNDLCQALMERVSETAYSGEQQQDAGIQSFPKTKKQLAADKLSSANKHTISYVRNGDHDASTSPTEVSPCLMTRLGSNGTSTSTSDRARGDKIVAVEDKKAGSDKNLDSSSEAFEASGMTIAAISERLITKVVLEEDQLCCSLNNESRLPLKLQTKFKKLDGIDQPGCSSDLSSSPLSEGSGLIFKSSGGQLLSSAKISSSLGDKCHLPASRKQSTSVSINPHSFLNSNHSMCSSTASSIGSSLLPANASLVRPFFAPGASHLCVNKLIETIIAESFVGSDDSGKSTSVGSTSASHTISSHFEDGRPTFECENGANDSQPLRHMNKMTDEIKTPRRKRNRKLDRPEFSFEDGALLQQTIQKADFRDNTATSDPMDGIIPRKRLKESTVPAPAGEFSPEISNTRFGLCAELEDSASLKLSGAWRLIDNILNEGTLDSNSRRTQEEINNNSREKAARNASHGGVTVPQANRVLRKSKRVNQGLRYKELMSKGVLYTSRKSTDCNLTEESREDAVVTNGDEVVGIDFDGVNETLAPRRHFLGDNNTLTDNDIDVNGRRYKSGDFDLEAHIACLPACHIEVPDRKSAVRMKSRSHSLSQCSASGSHPLVQIQSHRQTDLSSEDRIQSGVTLEKISFNKLLSMTRLPAISKNHRLFGSCRRKNRHYSFFQILPMSEYTGNPEVVQTYGTSDSIFGGENLLPSVAPSSTPSQQVSSFSLDVDRPIEPSKDSKDDRNFHVFSNASVSSGD